MNCLYYLVARVSLRRLLGLFAGVSNCRKHMSLMQLCLSCCEIPFDVFATEVLCRASLFLVLLMHSYSFLELVDIVTHFRRMIYCEV